MPTSLGFAVAIEEELDVVSRSQYTHPPSMASETKPGEAAARDDKEGSINSTDNCERNVEREKEKVRVEGRSERSASSGEKSRDQAQTMRDLLVALTKKKSRYQHRQVQLQQRRQQGACERHEVMPAMNERLTEIV